MDPLPLAMSTSGWQMATSKIGNAVRHHAMICVLGMEHDETNPLVLIASVADCRYLASWMTECHCYHARKALVIKYELIALQRLLKQQAHQYALPFLLYMPRPDVADQCLSHQHQARCTAHTGRFYYLKAKPIRRPLSSELVWGIRQCAVLHTHTSAVEHFRIRASTGLAWQRLPHVDLDIVDPVSFTYLAINTYCKCSPPSSLFIFSLFSDTAAIFAPRQILSSQKGKTMRYSTKKVQWVECQGLNYPHCYICATGTSTTPLVAAKVVL
ncbi:hypothetical protein V8C42DRAFT_48825 [Trichoderma barbatum]